MKKLLIAVVIILLMAVAAAVYYVITNLDAIVKAAIEEFGSEAVKTSVQVDKVAIGLAEGSASIQGFTVANPKGFSLPDAFSLGEAIVDINLEKTGKELIAIDRISIAAAQVFYEINQNREGSLNVLKDNLGVGAADADRPGGDDAGAGSGGADIKLEIARFEFSDASLHAKIAPLGDKTYDLKLPALVLTNLKGTPDQISRQILGRLIDHAKTEIRKQGLDRELAEIKAKAQQRIDEEKAKLKQDADERIDAEKQKAADKLKELLGQ
jgi:hypothetical protein